MTNRLFYNRAISGQAWRRIKELREEIAELQKRIEERTEEIEEILIDDQNKPTLTDHGY